MIRLIPLLLVLGCVSPSIEEPYDPISYLPHVLRQRCPVGHPVTIQVKDADGYHGYAERRSGRFFIVISEDLSPEAAEDTLIHEWAHLMTWGMEDDMHGPLWGQAYAKAYRATREQ